MTMKSYRAPTMAEALADVKRDLGRDAVILHTRSYRKGGFLGLVGGRPMWEVLAAPNVNVLRHPPKGQYVAQYPEAEDTRGTKQTAVLEPQPHREPVAVSEEETAVIGRQMAEMRRMIETLLGRQTEQTSQPPDELREFYLQLLGQEVDEKIADELMTQLRLGLTGQQLCDRQLIRGRLHALIAGRIPTAESFQPTPEGRAKVVSLIGPTGVGKTTTIAKLAANLKIREGKRVGLITIDTYRIAAVDQLRTYAEIIEVPVRAVLTPAELHQAVKEMSGLDVLLIDTAGRSQNDQLRLNQLRGFLAAAGADEVHLVVCATANRACVKSTLERFLPLGANRIVLTKLDEAETFGMVLNVAAAGVAMSFVTTGQDVPDDIEPANAPALAESIVGGSRYGD